MPYATICLFLHVSLCLYWVMKQEFFATKNEVPENGYGYMDTKLLFQTCWTRDTVIDPFIIQT